MFPFLSNNCRKTGNMRTGTEILKPCVFSFKNTNENELRKFIKNLNVRKTCKGSDIPTSAYKNHKT